VKAIPCTPGATHSRGIPEPASRLFLGELIEAVRASTARGARTGGIFVFDGDGGTASPPLMNSGPTLTASPPSLLMPLLTSNHLAQGPAACPGDGDQNGRAWLRPDGRLVVPPGDCAPASVEWRSGGLQIHSAAEMLKGEGG